MAKQRRRVRRDEHDQARADAHVRLTPDRNGLGSRISGFLPAEDAAYVDEALTRRADAVGPDPETGVWDQTDRRMAGTLRDMCAEDLARDAADGSDPDASVVIVHTPADAVVRNATEEPSVNATVNGQPIGDDALLRILCDTKIEFHVDNPDGATVGIGRASRTPPRWLRRRVVGREHGRCRFGCGRPIRHIHHMQHWTKDGPTDASNLVGVCWHHHHLLHEGGWNATGNADREVVFTSPYGRTIRSRAGPIAA